MNAIDKQHACNLDVTEETQEAYFDIRWLRGDAFRPGRKIKKVWFGICGYSHQICRVSANFFDTLVFSGVYVDKGRCEDATYCLATHCPLNKTPQSRIKKIIGQRPRQIVPIEVLTDPRHCNIFQKSA